MPHQPDEPPAPAWHPFDAASARGLRAPLVLALALTATLALAMAVPELLPNVGGAAFLPLHTALELVATTVNCMVFGLAWHLRGQLQAPYRPLLGCAALAAALIDLAHVLTHVGPPAVLSPGGTAQAALFWLVARLTGAAALLLLALLPRRRWPANRLLAAALAVAALTWWAGLHPAWLQADGPVHSLLAARLPLGLVLVALFGASAALLGRQAPRGGGAEWQWLAAAAWVNALSELCFTLPAPPGHQTNLLGHVFKAAACLLVYRGLFLAGIQQPQQDLARERAQLHALLSTIADPIWLKDEQGVYLACNAAFERLYGAPAARIVGRTDTDFVDSEQAAFFRANDRAAAAAGQPRRNEEWLRFAADGYLGLFDTTKTAMRSADGRLIGVLGLAHDITDERAMQQALQDSVRALHCLHQVFTLTEDTQADLAGQLQAVADVLPGAWRDPARTGVLLYLAGHRLASPGTASGTPATPADAAALRVPIALPGDPDAAITVWAAAPDGPQALPQAEPLQLLQAVAARLASVVRQRDTQHRLSEREAVFTAIAEQADDAIALVDQASGRFIEFNDAAARMLGYARDDFARLSVPAIEGQLDVRALQALMARVDRDGAATVTSRLRHRDGSLRDVLVRMRLLAGSGPKRLAVIWSDITEQQQALAELQRHRDHLETLVAQRTQQLARARDDAEAATQAKSRFLAQMSHELRTPLTAILGMAHLLRRAGATPQQAQRLATIDQAGEHLLRTVNSVLDLSKIEAGKLVLEAEPLRVDQLVAEVVTMLAERAAAKGLVLRTQVDAPPQPLLGDATRLRQALVNYVGNAIKFSQRGTVTLRVQAQPPAQEPASATASATASEAADATLLRFEVQDEGCGIDAPTLARLFSDFEQGQAGTPPQQAGTGLGLALTRALAREMGGDAGATATPGQGSTFWFTARLRHDNQPQRSAAPAPDLQAEQLIRRQHAGRRVLVTEDEPINREVIQCLLQEAGLDVTVAADGAQAVALATQQPFDLVLMDMQLPVLDGLQATRQIRAQPARAQLPILAFTAAAFADDKSQCLAAGMNDFISKPVDPPLLFATLLRWLPPAGRHAAAGAPAMASAAAAAAVPRTQPTVGA